MDDEQPPATLAVKRTKGSGLSSVGTTPLARGTAELGPPRASHPQPRIGLVIAVYVLLGAIGLGVVTLAAWMSDPCSPFCASASGSSYDELQSAVLGMGGFLYLAASIPLAILRSRRIVWLIPFLAFVVVTVGGVAILALGAEGGVCDCGL
jgi:hypothetical protein